MIQKLINTAGYGAECIFSFVIFWSMFVQLLSVLGPECPGPVVAIALVGSALATVVLVHTMRWCIARFRGGRDHWWYFVKYC